MPSNVRHSVKAVTDGRAIIGGGSLWGGEGSVAGTLIGAVIILVVWVDELRRRRMSR